jgi:hypothetical protein
MDGPILGVLIAACAGIVAGAVALAALPGWLARRRGHPSARAIAILGWFGAAFWPLWIFALAWTWSEPDRRIVRGHLDDLPDYHLGTPAGAGRRTGAIAGDDRAQTH